ncbi:hypothetical protein EDB87DRAFT_1582390 [Lactarius vividus]|nr:hypothetical protein EDB87DRAFT_1582390 [Lactarius vividus]
MPPRLEAGTPARHSLALFSEGHPARNEVDRALALSADPGAAGDVHRFRLLMRRKQDLFAWMRDLDIAWNDWLAEAEGIDARLRASNITSRIYPFLPQPLPRGLDVYHVDESNSNDPRVTPRVVAPALMSCVVSIRPGAMFRYTIRGSTDHAPLALYTHPDQNPTTDSTPSELGASQQLQAMERTSLERG